MCIWSILPINFQKNRRWGGGWNPPPPGPCGTENSVVLRGLSNFHLFDHCCCYPVHLWFNGNCNGNGKVKYSVQSLILECYAKRTVTSRSE